LDALILTIDKNPGNSNLRFNFSYSGMIINDFSRWIGDNYNVYIKSDGLYTDAYTTCSFAGFGSSFYFIKAPAKPKLYDIYYDYLCKDNIYTSYKVIEINKTISVPDGNYTTYVLQDTKSLTKEYWDEKNGIIKFELFDNTNILIGKYELASKNY